MWQAATQRYASCLSRDSCSVHEVHAANTLRFSLLYSSRDERSRRHAPSTHIPAFSSAFAFSPTLSPFEHFLAEFHHLRCFYDPWSSGHQQSRTHSYFCHPRGIGCMDVSASSSSTGSWGCLPDAHHSQYCRCEEPVVAVATPDLLSVWACCSSHCRRCYRRVALCVACHRNSQTPLLASRTTHDESL